MTRLSLGFNRSKSVAVITALLILVGCAGQDLKLDIIEKSENPQELINRLENHIALARKNQINTLSPAWFEKAEASSKDAKERLEEGGDLADIFDSIALGRAQLRQAEDNAKKSMATIPQTIKARDLARAAGATSLGSEYAYAENRFLDLTREIERDNLNYVNRTKDAVTQRFRELELKTIKIRTIGEVRRLIKQAEREKLQKIAPQSYNLAVQKLNEVDAFITQNPYAKEEMHALANEALLMARRLHVVAKESYVAETLEPEEIALWVESILYKTALQLKAPDMRDKPFEQQLETILASIAAQQSDDAFMVGKLTSQREDIKQLQKQIASLEGMTRNEQAEKERLMAEKRFNQLFSEVQSFFKPEEAEVYKKEDQLIIRLKAMQFPVGQSVILPKSYVLLSKVQQTIRTFGDPDVIIGGHTDSTGSAELNEHLSQQRAESVREYFVANGTLPYEKIIAVGYGSIRPIASNQTEAGRAMNRRIDIIIKPNLEDAK